MIQRKLSIHVIAALLLMGAVSTSCSDDNWLQDNNALSVSKTYTLTVQANKGIESTRALSLGASTINATWTEGEEVTVYNVSRSTALAGSLVAKSSGASTTLKGQLTGTIANGDVLKLKFLSPTYGTQDGTLTGSDTSIDKVCDYAEATVTVSSVTDGYVMTTGSASFTNQQTIVKFTLLDKGDSDATINPSSLTVGDGENSVSLFNIPNATYATNGNGVLYVAFPAAGAAKNITLNVIGGSKHYFYEESDVTFNNGKYYDITVKLASKGALPGKFTINAGGEQVNFSQGNLQYQASTGTWRFAVHQYDYMGYDNANISGSYSGWIDLFGWGTGNNPTNSSTNNGTYSSFTDWGVNAISNGGNTADMWRTLSNDEWGYLINDRTNAANLRTLAIVNGVNGVIIMPDGWSGDLTITSTIYETNILTLSQWKNYESEGCVFFPGAGHRYGTGLNGPGGYGGYWSTTSIDTTNKNYFIFGSDVINPHGGGQKCDGRSVRLVYEIPFLGSGTEADPYLISSKSDWYYLANRVRNGNAYSGKFFRQTADIDVNTMVGVSTSRPFSGTYDGDGKTLNLNLSTSESHTAPFRFIANATIKNVVTTGSVHSTSNHPSGLVGETDGTCTIQNCRVGANVGGAQHSGGIVGHCYHANISIIGCVYSGTLSPASGQYTGGIIGWGGDGGGHTMTISNCLFAGSVNGSTSFHPVGIVQNTNNTRTVSNTYYTVAHNLNNEDTHGNSFVNSLSYKGKFARSITAGTGVTVANAGAATVYDVSGITSYGTGILYGGVLYAGNGEAVSLTLSHAAAPAGYTFSQYTVTGGGTLSTPTSNSPTLTMTDANQTINVEWFFNTLTFNYTGAVQTFTVPTTGYYTLECYGAQGGNSSSGQGGKGGLSQLTYSLTQGDVLYIYVGGQGGSVTEHTNHPEGGDGGWNGGGKGGTGIKRSGSGTTNKLYSGGGGGGGATHVATSAIGAITSSTNFTDNHANLLLIAGGGGGGCHYGEGGHAGGASGEVGSNNYSSWSIDWNNGTYSCGKDGMTSTNAAWSAEGCGGGGAGYQGGNTWTVTENAQRQCYSGAGGSSWGDEINGKSYTTTDGGATEGGNGKAIITWYGTTYPTE